MARAFEIGFSEALSVNLIGLPKAAWIFDAASTANRVESRFPFEYSSTVCLSFKTAQLFCYIKLATQIFMALIPEHSIAINPMLGKVSH